MHFTHFYVFIYFMCFNNYFMYYMSYPRFGNCMSVSGGPKTSFHYDGQSSIWFCQITSQ